MKTTILLLSAIVATFSFTALAGTGAQSLKASPSLSLPAAASLTTIAYVEAASPALLTPRAQSSQSRTLKGTSSETSVAFACAKNMSGGPKAIQACAEHPATMPGCNPTTVTAMK